MHLTIRLLRRITTAFSNTNNDHFMFNKVIPSLIECDSQHGDTEAEMWQSDASSQVVPSLHMSNSILTNKVTHQREQ